MEGEEGGGAEGREGDHQESVWEGQGALLEAILSVGREADNAVMLQIASAAREVFMALETTLAASSTPFFFSSTSCVRLSPLPEPHSPFLQTFPARCPPLVPPLPGPLPPPPSAPPRRPNQVRPPSSFLPLTNPLTAPPSPASGRTALSSAEPSGPLPLPPPSPPPSPSPSPTSSLCFPPSPSGEIRKGKRRS